MMETITIAECRSLREMITAFTSGCLLNKDEYLAIMSVLNNAGARLEKEGKIKWD